MAKHIPREFIDDLLTRVDIVDIIGQHLSLKRTGSNFVCRCPFHEEKTPSFSVSPNKQIYHCFGCSESGNVIGFLMAHEHMQFVETIEYLAQHAGIQVPFQLHKSSAQTSQQENSYECLNTIARFYQQQFRQPQSTVAIDYLKQRGLTGKICKDYGIGFAPPGWDNVLKKFGNNPANTELLSRTGMIITKERGGHYDRFRNRIMFPIRDRRGRVIGFGGRVLGDDTPKYLNSPESPVFHKGKELYGLYEALQVKRKLENIIVVEGYMDVVALAQYGFDNCVATLGTATSRDHIQQLFRYVPQIIVCFDGDRAGQVAAWRALTTSLSLLQDGRQIRFLFLPEGDDPDSYIREHGTEAFQQLLSTTISTSDFFWQELRQSTDIGSIESRSQLIHKALPLLKQLPESSYRHMMLEQLSQYTRMDVSRIEAMMSDGEKQEIQTNTQNKAVQPSAMRLAIALLLQNPSLISETNELNLALLGAQPGSDLLKQLMDRLKQNNALNTAAILEHFRDTEHNNALHKLASMPLQIPEAGLKTEFLHTVKRLEQQQRNQQIQQLLAKANLSTLNNEEREQLQLLIRSNKS